jgi:hypothetical protein
MEREYDYACEPGSRKRMVIGLETGRNSWATAQKRLELNENWDWAVLHLDRSNRHVHVGSTCSDNSICEMWSPFRDLQS